MDGVRDILSTYSYALKNVDNAKYHHNAPYKDAPLIIKYGVLSMENINKFDKLLIEILLIKSTPSWPASEVWYNESMWKTSAKA